MRIALPAPAESVALTVLAPAAPGAAKVAGQLAPAIAGTVGAGDGQRSVRALGTRQMEGLTVEGLLETSSIPAGKTGNTLPIVSSTETWHSSELNLDLYVRSVDPRYGERVTRVQHIRRGEPRATLFKVPAGYTVQQIARP